MPSQSTLQGFFTVTTESERTGMSKPQLTYLCRHGGISAVKVAPKLWLIERASLDAYIEKHIQLEKEGRLRGRRRTKKVSALPTSS